MDADRLKRIPLFAQLSHRELAQIGRWADELEVGEGRHIVDQGDFGYEFFAILDGTAEVLKDGERIATLGPATSSARSPWSPGAAGPRRWWRRPRCTSPSC